MSAFAHVNALEDADNTDLPEGEAPSEVDSASNALAEAGEASGESADADNVAENVGKELAEVEDTEAALEAEAGGLSPLAAQILHRSMTRILGKNHANKIVSMENYASSNSGQREAKQIALEGIKDTLKQFWEAIKAACKKFYNKVKSYFVKLFSAARKLKDRAEALQKKANDTVGTIEDKSFSFGQTKTVAVDGKYSDASTLLSGLNNIRKWIEGNIKVEKADKYESIVEKAQKDIEKQVNKAANGKAVSNVKIATELQQAGVIAIAPLSTQKADVKLAEQYGGGKGGTATVEMSISLPGSTAIFSIRENAGGTSSVEDQTKQLKNSRLVLGNDKYNGREVSEGDVKTLTTSQIDKVCDDVIEIAESAYTYEKAWERRDKFQEKLEKEIDSVMKEIDNDSDQDSRKARLARNFAESFTASVRRRTSFESQFIGYALNTASAFLNYSERSLAQHKSK